MRDIHIAAPKTALREIEPADDDGEHIVEVVSDAAGELADGLHLLSLAQLVFGAGALGHFIGDALFERRVQRFQLLEQTRIVDGCGGLAGNAKKKGLVFRLEYTDVLVAEEQSTEHLARARRHRHGKV